MPVSSNTFVSAGLKRFDIRWTGVSMDAQDQEGKLGNLECTPESTCSHSNPGAAATDEDRRRARLRFEQDTFEHILLSCL